MNPLKNADPHLLGLLFAISNLLKLIGAWMIANGFGDGPAYRDIMLASGAVLIIGPGIGDVVVAIANMRRARAQGVSAGVEMTVRGAAEDADGNPISAVIADANSTPPKPVTLASADKIVKDFGPTSASIAKK